jgi:hypothetical protein
VLPVPEVGELAVVPGGVEVAADLVAGAGKADVPEEGLGREPAAAAVRGEAVVIEAVVGGSAPYCGSGQAGGRWPGLHSGAEHHKFTVARTERY